MRFDDQYEEREEEGEGFDDTEKPDDFKGPGGSAISPKTRRSIESTDQEDSPESDFSYDDADDEFENFINRTYVCEECDFRWAEKIFPDRNDFPDYDDEMGHAHICPMCGSTDVSFY
jgi:rubrerythrin